MSLDAYLDVTHALMVRQFGANRIEEELDKAEEEYVLAEASRDERKRAELRASWGADAKDQAALREAESMFGGGG